MFGVRTLRRGLSALFKNFGSSRTARGKLSSNSSSSSSSSSSHSQLKAAVTLSAGHHHRRLAAATAAMAPAQAGALTPEAGLAGRSMTACKFLQAL